MIVITISGDSRQKFISKMPVDVCATKNVCSNNNGKKILILNPGRNKIELWLKKSQKSEWVVAINDNRFRIFSSALIS